MSKVESRHPLNRGAISTKPIWQMPIPLVLVGDCICWPDSTDRTPTISSEDLRKAIARSANQYLPNEHLASFGPGDVVVATDGLFWLTSEWAVIPLDADNSQKAKQILDMQ